MADLFYEICCDLITAIQETPLEATRAVLVRRLERWSSLLRGKRSGLSQEAQRGLMAELIFLERIAIPDMGEANAIRGWVGPERAYQDFRYGQTMIEVKSKHGASSSEVKVSSEHQLMANDTERLFLYVVEENEANGPGGFSLDELVARIKSSLSSPIAKNEFNSKLLAIGYVPSGVYDETSTIGSTSIYEVKGDFPRITDAGIGISHISYSLNLATCVEYESTVETITNCLRGDHD